LFEDSSRVFAYPGDAVFPSYLLMLVMLDVAVSGSAHWARIIEIRDLLQKPSCHNLTVGA